MRDNIESFILVAVFFIITFICGHYIGYSGGINFMKKSAIKNGVAKYHLIDQTNQIKFYWQVGTNSIPANCE